jgi:hypothetical protein
MGEANKTLNSIYVLSTDGKSLLNGTKDLRWIGASHSTTKHTSWFITNPSQFPKLTSAALFFTGKYKPECRQCKQAFTKNRSDKMERR